MVKPECKHETRVSKIRFEERRRKAVFINPKNEAYFRIKIDGCEIVDGTRAELTG
jgi:hypothetical protein